MYLKQVLEENGIKNNDNQINKIYRDMVSYIKDGSAIIVGAFEEKKMIGFIWAYERYINDEKRYHINYFIISRENRKQGIGQKLMNQIYIIAKKNKVKKIELMVTMNNESAVKFYQKQNFKAERIMLCKEI